MALLGFPVATGVSTAHAPGGLLRGFIDSERGLEWRCSDSLSLREFLRLESRDRVPDHSWLSRTRARLPHEVHTAIFDWVLALIAEAGLVKGERIGVDASTMEANAALRNIVRRDTGEGRVPGDAGALGPGELAASRHPRPRTWRAWTASARARSSRTRTGSRRATPRPRSPR